MANVDAVMPAGPTANQSPGRLGRIMHGDGDELGGFNAISDVAACLMPLLRALGWHGKNRHLAEALPHFAESLDIQGLRQVLANLNYESREARIRLRDVDPRLAPCLFLPDHGPAFVVLDVGEKDLTVFNSQSLSVDRLDPRRLKGKAYFFTKGEDAREIAQRPGGDTWFETTARRFRGLVLQMMAVTFLTSIVAVIVPLFIMTVYDKVVPARSQEMLFFLATGVLFTFAFEMAMRVVRARLLAYVGGRIDLILGQAAFQQVLHLPILMTERATIGAQVSRLKQFESVREFFTGQLANVIIELPFAVIFIGVIAIIAGPVAWIPAALMVLFALIAVFSVPAMRRAIARSGEARSQKQSFMIEMLSEFRTIKNCAAERIWSKRFREMAARSAVANFHTSQVSSVVQTLAQALVMAAGVATIGVGTIQVMAGEMTVGALIACMALIWRILGPIQVCFLSLSRFEQLKLGLRQVNQLMTLKLEREPGRVVERRRTLKGEIAFQRVSLRYSPTAEPALLGIELEVNAGELIAITGPSSSGKSSLLKLVAGLYQPQAGVLLIDGMDMRQLDLGELRDSVAYLPQVCHLFHGTIAQNLRLANPIASDEELSQAVLDAGLLGEIMSLPDGFETRITDQLRSQLPGGFKQRLMLARTYVKNARFYVLDEPVTNLDDEGDAALRRKLQSLRGNATVFITTHRPSHMRLADRVVVLNQGRLLAADTPEVILPRLGIG